MSKKLKDENLPSMDDMVENFMEGEQSDDQEPGQTNDTEEEEEEVVKKSDRKGPAPSREMKPLKEGGKISNKESVRFYDENNIFRGRRPLELQGLSSKMLPPITKRRLAVYEVIGKNGIDPLTNEQILSTPLILPGKYLIYDPFQRDVLKRHVLLRNVTRSETVIRDKKEVIEDVTEDIIFPDGNKIVNMEKNYLEYCLLELHPLNESNRYRDRSQAPAFKRVDMGYRKEWAETPAGMDLAFEAETVVVNMRKGEDIITYATAAGIPTVGRMLEGGDSSVKMDLRKFARNSPREFFKLNKKNSMAVRMAVNEAIELGLVEYHVDRRSWLFATDGARLCEHLPGEDATESLIKYLSKEDYLEVYQELQDQLNYWE